MKSFAGWRVRRDAASEPEKPLRDELLSIDRLEERALAGIVTCWRSRVPFLKAPFLPTTSTKA